MVKKRRTLTTEFKLEAAGLVLDQNYSIAEASRSIGVGEGVLRRWVCQIEAERSGATPGNKALTAEQQRIQALEKRVKQLEVEKDILEKATALLMSDELPRTC